MKEVEKFLNTLRSEKTKQDYERYINDLSQSEVSKQMCMTQSMVSRKEKEILTRLRVRLR